MMKFQSIYWHIANINRDKIDDRVARYVERAIHLAHLRANHTVSTNSVAVGAAASAGGNDLIFITPLTYIGTWCE